MRNNRAHTLLEVLLVVGILAVIAGANVPRLRWLAASTAFENDISRLTGFFIEAQKRALRGHGRFLVKIDTAQNSFLLYNENFSGLQGASPIKSVKINENTRIEASELQLIFYPDGHVTPARVRLSAREQSAVLSSEDQWGKILVMNDKETSVHDDQ